MFSVFHKPNVGRHSTAHVVAKLVLMRAPGSCLSRTTFPLGVKLNYGELRALMDVSPSLAVSALPVTQRG